VRLRGREIRRTSGCEMRWHAARMSAELPKNGAFVPRDERCRKVRRRWPGRWSADAPVKKAATRTQLGISRRHLTGSSRHAFSMGAEHPHRERSGLDRLCEAVDPLGRLTQEGRLIDSKIAKTFDISRSSGSCSASERVASRLARTRNSQSRGLVSRPIGAPEISRWSPGMGIEAELQSLQGGTRSATPRETSGQGPRRQYFRGVARERAASDLRFEGRCPGTRRDCRFDPKTRAARALQTSLVGTAP
jgi:hypothetical protein